MAIRNGNNGSNFLFGTFGSDEINGRGGNDVLFGWFGNDILRGGNGNDWLFGGFGSDRLFGGNGNDWLFGGSGSDRLYGGNGDDVGFGGSGNDRLVGGRGSDTMFGGSGNDTFVYRAERNVGETDFYAGGSGNDRLVLRLNADEAADANIQADIAAFEDFIAAGGGGNFTFDSLGLTVNSIERLTVRAPDPVEPTNTAPVVDGALTLAASDENTIRSISFSDLLAGASDADGDTLTVSNIVVESGNATVTGGDGGIDVAPDLDDETVVILSYTISDGNGGSVQQTATFDLLRVNQDPTVGAAIDLGAIDENTTRTVTTVELLAGASDADDDDLSITEIAASGGATVELVDGAYVITPVADDESEVTLTYTISDGAGGEVEQTALLDLQRVNDAPTVTNGGAPLEIGPFDEDTSLFVSAEELTSNIADADGDPLNISAAGVTVTAGDATVTEENGGYRITPAADFNTDPGFINLTLGYTVEDGQGGSVDTTANVSVTGVQDAPEAPDEALTVGEDGSLTFSVADLEIVDADGDALSFAIAENNTSGDLQINGGSAIYTPGSAFQDLAEGEQRDDTFIYTVTDGLATSTGTVTVTVEGENDAPVADDIAFTINESETVSFDLDDFASDVDDANLTFELNPTPATLGEIELNDATGEVTYTPGRALEALNAGETLEDTFFYTVFDGIETTEGEVTITVNGESTSNQAPVAMDDPEPFGGITVLEPVGFFPSPIDVLFNDSDPDGDDLDIISVGLPGEDAILFGAEGTEVELGGLAVERVNGELGEYLSIRATDDTTRQVDLIYTISDGSLTDSATLSLFVPGPDEQF